MECAAHCDRIPPGPGHPLSADVARAAAPVAPPRRWSPALALLLLAGLVAYADSFTGVFLLDDNWWIEENADLPFLGRFTASWFPGRWLPAATVEFNYRLGGRQVTGYHALNLAIHVAAALVLFGIVRRTLLLPAWRARLGGQAEGVALAVALLWVVHPLNTQSVTYIIQRCEALMALFYLLTLYCVVRSADARHPGRWHGAAVVSFTLGLGCKEVIATAPLVVLLFDGLLLSDSFRSTLRRRANLYAGLAGLWVLLIGYNVMRLATAPPGDTVGFTSHRLTPWTYLMSEAGVLLHYLRLSVWPVGQCFDYADWPITTAWQEFAVPGLCVAAVVLAGILGVLRRSVLGLLTLTFFVILAPTSSVVPINDLAFEHRMYLPLAAVIAAIVIAGAAGVERVANCLSVRLSAVATSLVLGAAVALTALTYARNADYRSGYTLWHAVLEQRPNNTRADVSIQPSLERAGLLEDGLPLLERALATEPGNHHVLSALISVHLELDHVAEVRRLLAAMEAMVPDLPGLSKSEYAARAAVQQAVLAVKTGDVETAAAQVRRALAIKPNSPVYRLRLAGALAQLGRSAAADDEYAQVIAVAPELPAAFGQRARSLLLGGQTLRVEQRRQALAYAFMACASPQHATPRDFDTLAMALAANGRLPDAADVARRGLARAQARGTAVWVEELGRHLRQYEAGAAQPKRA